MTAIEDLRGFLDALDREGQLVRVGEPVDCEPDLAAAANAAARLGDKAPALYFTLVNGFTNARIVLNAHGSWPNHAIAMGMDRDTPVREQIQEFTRRWDDHPVAPVHRGDPPFLENVQEGPDVDLFRVLPLFRVNEGDGGFFLDKASVISRDPDHWDDTGRQNVGIYRLQVKGPNKLGLQPGTIHDIAHHLRIGEERGEDVPVAIAVGNDPVVSIVASAPIAYDQSEYEMAGALRGSPVTLAKGPLTGLDVPWGTEVLLEGVIEGRVREFEGPFGEFTGHYSGGRAMAVIRIDRISYRDDPVFEHLHLGRAWTEIDYLMGPATCVPLYQQLKEDFPEVVAVNAMYTHGLVAIVSVRPRQGGFARAVGLRAMTSRHGLGYCKVVIVVDEDVDPFDLPQVMWALSTKVNPDEDMVHLSNMSILPLDPSSSPVGVSGKVVIDATAPVAPDVRGRHAHPVRDHPDTDRWLRWLRERTKER
ncbi:non-oxidative hydroxyarylic acid decarboxylases subunit C [Nocardiopsis sp. JB363]|uniref:non-oxidative hydroxyarylic acid decarboxylases subunit C n=1 Tax=Nocardiopsis sp. JB363 TaxID=1434837 RepID=UPI00097B32CC|nr:non-oxidative hydroxyarylic acid decarboxylases subunit C [Nocardiopsis sp. JB363]SIO88795.1 Hydroxyaromatic non-oxidative decarboxylase protein C [Nocardiopsis sp. JB363]